MKIQLSILFVCFLLILPGNANLSAQVTIGAKGPPGNGILPDLKEKDVTSPTQDITSLENSAKGVLHPKVFLRDASKLTPLHDGSGVWGGEITAEEKLKAKGMVAYNINPDAINMDEGLYIWQTEKWVELNQDGAAIIQPVGCSALIYQESRTKFYQLKAK